MTQEWDIPGIGTITFTPEAKEETIEEKRERWAREAEDRRLAFMVSPLHAPETSVSHHEDGTSFTLRLTRAFTREELQAWLAALPANAGPISAARGRSYPYLTATVRP